MPFRKKLIKFLKQPHSLGVLELVLAVLKWLT